MATEYKQIIIIQSKDTWTATFDKPNTPVCWREGGENRTNEFIQYEKFNRCWISLFLGL